MKQTHRNLKIYGKTSSYDKSIRIPTIILHGKWLTKFGYNVGSRINIHCTDEKITITKSLDS